VLGKGSCIRLVTRIVNSFGLLFSPVPGGRNMSIVRKPVVEPTNTLLASTEAGAGAADIVVEAVSAAPAAGMLNLSLHGSYTGRELREGVLFNLSDYPCPNVPKERIIVSEIKTTGIGSNAGANVMLSTNIFNNKDSTTHYLQSGVENGSGWVTTTEQDHVVPLGFCPLVNLMPNEYNRASLVHYTPSSGVDDQLVQRYGHLNGGDALRAGVVPFPGEDYYYVQKDHVVLDIIEKNWESLGQSMQHERVRDGSWIKVSNQLVDKVLDELDNSVLRHMPLTDLGKLQFSLKSDAELGSALKASESYPISVNLQLSYRSLAPELSET
jgi:hypothetical protein